MANCGERLSERKWGVFHHYLQKVVCNPNLPHNKGIGEIPWNDAVNKFDVEKLAYSLHKMNVGYYFITLMQGDKYMLAPNETYDKIAGTKPGEACSTRDIPAELIKEFSKYDIDLGLYFTGDGPYQDSAIGPKFGFVPPRKNVSEEFCRKWASVLEEYAVRYGDGVKAWWIDGCVRNEFGYTDDLMSIYYDAVKKGNPDAAATFNNGVAFWPFCKNFVDEDFTAGEANSFAIRAQRKYNDGALTHIFAPMGWPAVDYDHNSAWCNSGMRETKEYLASYIRQFNGKGGIVTIDTMVHIDGSFDPEQEAALRFIGQNI